MSVVRVTSERERERERVRESAFRRAVSKLMHGAKRQVSRKGWRASFVVGGLSHRKMAKWKDMIR